MTLVLNLPPDVEARLTQRAKAAGKDVSAYANELILDGLDQPPNAADILAPFHAASTLSNASEEELTQFTNELINQSRKEKRDVQGRQ